MPAGGGGAWPGSETTRPTKRQRPRVAGVKGAGGTGGHGRASRRGAERSSRRGRLAGGPPPTGTHSDQAPLVWRVPGGTCRGAGGRRRGLAGLRDDAPSEARGADDSRAGRRPAAHTVAGPSGARNTRGATSTTGATSNTAQHRGAGPQARAPSATTQILRSTCVPFRSARAAHRSRRSSRSPRLRRRAGPRR